VTEEVPASGSTAEPNITDGVRLAKRTPEHWTRAAMLCISCLWTGMEN